MAHFGNSSFSSQRRPVYPPIGSAFFGQSYPPNAFALNTNFQPQSSPSYTMHSIPHQRSIQHKVRSDVRSDVRSGARSAPVFTTDVPPISHVQLNDQTIRPFVEACRMCYDRLAIEFQTATQHMKSGKTQVRINPNLIFMFQNKQIVKQNKYRCH